MELERLTLKNFGVHRALELDFRPGINGIVGSNGSGKSTILDAFRLLVTGEVASPGNMADNVSWGETSASVVGVFKHGDTRYELTRTIGRSKQPAELKFDDQVIRTSNDIEKYLCKMLNTTMKALLNNVFVAQGQIDQILFSTNSERLREIQQTVGLHRCADAEKALTAELGRYPLTVGLKEQVESTESQLVQATSDLETVRAEVGAVQQQIDKMIPVERQLVTWLSDRNTRELIIRADADLVACKASYESAQADLAEALRGASVASDAMARLKPFADQAERDLIDHQTSQKTRELRTQLQSQRQALQESVAASDAPSDAAVLAKEQELQHVSSQKLSREDQLAGRSPRPKMPGEQEAAEQRDALSTWLTANKTRSLSETERQLAGEIKEMRHRLHMFSTGKCPTCDQPVAGFDKPQLEASLAELERKLREETAALDKAFSESRQSKLTELEQATAKIRTCEAAATATLTKICSDLAQKRTALEVELRELTGRRRAHDQLTDRLSAVNKQLSSLGDDSGMTVVDVTSLQSAVAAFREATARHTEAANLVALRKQAAEQAATQVTQAQTRRQALQQSGNLPTDEQLEQAQQTVKALRIAQDQLRKLSDVLVQRELQVSQLTGMVDRMRVQLQREARDAQWSACCRRARDVLHVSGLPSLLMREYAKVLNQRMAYYMEVWEAEFTFVLDDELSFIATYPDGRSHAASRLSGGQKIVASTAFRLAMADTFARQVGVLVLDEPTNYLDSDNIVHLQNLLLKLKELAGHSGKQIILVTHEDQLTGFFDHNISLYR